MVFPVAMAFAGAMDLLTMTIPNRISLALLAAFPCAALAVGMPWSTFVWHLGAGAAVLALGFLLFSLGWVGGGDAKLLAAAALWLGFDNLLSYAVLVSILGGALALLVLSYRMFVPPLWIAHPAWAARLHDRKTGMPYGLALAGAALWIYPSTAWFVVT
ncbi:MAG TPA: prepilin peptidase [Hyphomicrobiaceae bacterium]|nr:prepilin peptidase [Hyphomicrobiaceae bacterium]